MQKILRKRVLRDLKENFFRYLALGLLIILCMYMIGSLVGAGETIVQGVDEQAEKITRKMVSLPVLCRYQKIIKSACRTRCGTGKDVLPGFCQAERDDSCISKPSKINLVALREGRLAEKENEIVLERRYAEEHQYTVGSQITLGKSSFR